MSDKTDNPNAEHLKATDARAMTPEEQLSADESLRKLEEAEALMNRRKNMLWWVLAPFIFVIFVSFVSLLLSVYVGWPKSFDGDDPQPSSLPMNIFISGTFISVIAVFTFARNILDPVADKRDKNKSTGLIDAVRRVVGPAD